MIPSVAGVVFGTAAAMTALALLGLTDVPPWKAALAGALLGLGIIGWVIAVWQGSR